MLSPEEKLLHELTVAIARGTYITGELLPNESELAHDRLIGPNKVSSVYQQLAVRGLVADFGDHRTMVVENAANLARTVLLEELETSVRASVAELISAGCSALEIQAVLSRVLER
jgi:DNA-binding transcriptional regulator YhcF (GntR family)